MRIDVHMLYCFLSYLNYIVCLHTQLIWKRFYSVTSGRQKGTLYQMKNLVHRTSIPMSPKNNMNATEDFMEVLMDSHLISATLQLLDLRSMKDITSDTAQLHSLRSIAERIVETFIQPFFFGPKPTTTDEVYCYACDFLTHALIWCMHIHICNTFDRR